MTSEPVRIDSNKWLLHFSGACLEVLPFCRALCCHDWNVMLSDEEAASARYSSEAMCLVSNQICRHCQSECLNQRIRLKRKVDGACAYLNENHTCSNYADRPLVCRQFSCQSGWKLQGVAPSAQASEEVLALERDQFIGRLTPAHIFRRNPLLEFKMCVYAPVDREIVLVAKPVDRCSILSAKRAWYVAGVTEEILHFFIAAIDGQATLGQVCESAVRQFGPTVDLPMIYALTWLFHEQRLIVYSHPSNG